MDETELQRLAIASHEKWRAKPENKGHKMNVPFEQLSDKVKGEMMETALAIIEAQQETTAPQIITPPQPAPQPIAQIPPVPQPAVQPVQPPEPAHVQIARLALYLSGNNITAAFGTLELAKAVILRA